MEIGSSSTLSSMQPGSEEFHRTSDRSAIFAFPHRIFSHDNTTISSGAVLKPSQWHIFDLFPVARIGYSFTSSDNDCTSRPDSDHRLPIFLPVIAKEKERRREDFWRAAIPGLEMNLIFVLATEKKRGLMMKMRYQRLLLSTLLER